MQKLHKFSASAGKYGALGLILVSVSGCVIAPAAPYGGAYEEPCCYAYNDYPGPYYGTLWEPTIGFYGEGFHGYRHHGGWGGRR